MSYYCKKTHSILRHYFNGLLICPHGGQAQGGLFKLQQEGRVPAVRARLEQADAAVRQLHDLPCEREADAAAFRLGREGREKDGVGLRLGEGWSDVGEVEK